MPSETLVKPAAEVNADLEAMFQQSIPCEHCPNPAAYRSFGHQVDDCGAGQGNDTPPYYKCAQCFATWHWWATDACLGTGVIRCLNCFRLFDTPEEFSDYREF